jgi:hypothetical protein
MKAYGRSNMLSQHNLERPESKINRKLVLIAVVEIRLENKIIPAANRGEDDQHNVKGQKGFV